MNTPQNTLDELGEIGAEATQKAFCRMLCTDTSSQLVSSEIVPFDTVSYALNKHPEVDYIETVVFVEFGGDIPGMVLLCLEPLAARKLAQQILHPSGGGLAELGDFHGKLDKLSETALRNIGEVITQASMAEVADHLKIQNQRQGTYIVTDMHNAIIDSIVSEFGGQATGEVCLQDIAFSINQDEIRGNLHFLWHV